MLGVDPPAVVLLSQSLVNRISDVANSARNAVVEQDISIQLACYLERMVPIGIELQRGRDTSPMIREILEALVRDIDCVDRLIKECSNKSRIYQVTHSRSIAQQLERVLHDLGRSLCLIPLSSVQGQEDTKAVIDSLSRDMQQVHFEVKLSDDRICQLLSEDSLILQNDPDLQADLLLGIARSVGIEDAPRNPSALKLHVELLRNDLQGATEAYDLQMMDLLGNMVENWVQGTDSVSPLDEASTSHREHKRVEPLYEAFVCFLTKTIMRDPVTLENGETYERSAIEKWFRECRENGRPAVCPATGKELQTTALKPSLALRHAIEEWTSRNEIARIENARVLLTSNTQQDILHGLKDIQVLCGKSRLNKYKVRNQKLIPLIVDCLKEGEQVRCSALATLRLLAEDENDNKEAIGETVAIRSCVKCLSRDVQKEREEAASLLYELSKYPPLCEKIGNESGAILVLVGIVSSDSDNDITAQKAEKTLENLEGCDQNVRQMAVNGRLLPLLQRLVEGGEEVRLEMAVFLAELVLSREGKVKAAAMGGKTLVDMLESGYSAGREAALKCLCQLSAFEGNGKILAEVGILRPLIRDLFVVGVNQLPMKLKEVAATTLANIVNSGVDLEKIPIDADGNTLISEPILHNLLHLVSNTGPAIEAKLLQVLVGLASSSQASGRVTMAIKSAGATVSLIQFLEAPQKELRANSIKLLYHLCSQMGQEVAESLRITTGQLGTLVRLLGMSGVTEEQAAAARLLANLPSEDAQLTRALLDEGALPTVVKQLDELRQGVSRIGAGRFVSEYKEGLVGILARFTLILGDTEMVSLAQEYNLTALFTTLLNTAGLDEVQRLSAVALANLSVYSKDLSVLPEIKQKPSCWFPFRSAALKPSGLCIMHGGLCSAKQTFCLLEARAVPSLVACLDHENVGVVEASLRALLTLLMDSETLEGGIQVLSNADAIQPILDIMREHKTERLRQQAVVAVECMLRSEEIARTIATDGNVHTALVEAFKYGNNNTKQAAEKALKHLNKIPNFSGVFQTRKH
eukprot:c20452_g1_i2 orf=270-3377(-)